MSESRPILNLAKRELESGVPYRDWARDLEARATLAQCKADREEREPVVARYPLTGEDVAWLRALDTAFHA